MQEKGGGWTFKMKIKRHKGKDTTTEVMQNP